MNNRLHLVQSFETWPIDLVFPYKNSITTLTKAQSDALGESLKLLGQIQPLVGRFNPADSDSNTILLIDGNKRLELMKSNCIDVVKLINVGEVDDELARQIHLVLNLNRGRPLAQSLADNLEATLNSEDIEVRAETELRLLKILPVSKTKGIKKTIKKLRRQKPKHNSESEESFVGFKFRVERDAAKVCDDALSRVEKIAECKRDRAFELLCADALAGKVGG